MRTPGQTEATLGFARYIDLSLSLFVSPFIRRNGAILDAILGQRFVCGLGA